MWKIRRLVDVYELIINGQEISPGYSELNDPVVQRRRLTEQVGEEIQNLDEDFLLALEHGMPPAGGIGVGIDRLVMALTGADSIREVILFPHLKPKSPRMTTASAAPTIPEVPPQATNSFRFSLFNAVNFQITLGAPMVLYAKALGGSATTIGIVASLAPLMTVLQLPTAYFIPKVGYKGFVLFGWTVRAVIIVHSGDSAFTAFSFPRRCRSSCC